MNQRILIPFFILGLLLPAFLSAQPKSGKISFVASTSKKEVAEGSLIEITFKLTGTASGQLRVPSFHPFRQSGGTQEMSGMQFSGGDIQAHHTWVFSLTAPGPGDYTIPEAIAIVNGTTYRSAPIQVKVFPAGKGTPGGGITSVPKGSDANLFITTEFSRTSVFVGQQVICTVNVYTKYNLAGIDLTSLPKAGTAAMTELERFDMPVTEELVGGVKYTKRAIYAAAFFPEKAGKITVASVQANIAIEPTNIFMPTRAIPLTAAPAFIEVKPLPVPAPQGFTGVVGEYHAEVKTDHDTAVIGEAFICEISIRGNGNGRYFAPPKLTFPQGLESFDPVVKEDESFENGKELIHRQVLEYAISAKQTGDYNCEPTIVWFDPDSSKYISFSPKLTLKVVAGDSSVSNKVNALPNRFSKENELWTSPKFIGAVSLGAAVLLLVIYFLFFKKRETLTPPVGSDQNFKTNKILNKQEVSVQQTHPSVVPEMPVATRTAHHTSSSLQQLLYTGEAKTFYQTVYEAIKNNFAKRMGMQANTLTTDQIAGWMAANGYDTARIADLRFLFQICEQALYAGKEHSAAMELFLEKAKQFIQP